MKHIATFLYGSQVYETQDDESDIDYIVVVDKLEEEGKQTLTDDINITYYSTEYFQQLLDEHDVAAVECYINSPFYKMGGHSGFKFTLDKMKLRKSFSATASNSWVKAKKKIDVEKEYYIGRKSLFHSIRILSLGINIAINFPYTILATLETVKFWEKIKGQNFETWKEHKDFWQPTYNKLKSEFKKVAPLEE